MRPLIAVPGMRSAKVHGLRRNGIAASEKVLDAIVCAGGDPVVLPPLECLTAHRLDPFDAVVLPGGRDMDPKTYGQTADSQAEVPDDIQDRIEMQLVLDCIRQDKPLLAICRGMQVVNVALGGSLTQDITSNEVPHRNGFHVVELEPGSRVAKAMGLEQVNVSSYHHQAVDRLGQGLRVTGRTSDGCPETLEHETAPFLLVQWHPEDDADVVAHEQALFDAVVDAGRSAIHETRPRGLGASA